MLSHLLVSFPPRRGSGRARGAVWRVRVCDCDEGPLARDHWVCIINNEGALKKNIPLRLSTKFRTLALSESVAHRMEPLPLTLEHLNPELHVAIGSALADDPASAPERVGMRSGLGMRRLACIGLVRCLL